VYLEIMFLVILVITFGYAGKIGFDVLRPNYRKIRFQFVQPLLSFVDSRDDNTGRRPSNEPISYKPLFRSIGETTDIRE